MLELRVPFDPVLIGSVDADDASREATLRRAVNGMRNLENLYGQTYLAVSEAHRWAREDAPEAPDEEMVDKIDKVRRDLVLAHRSAIRRLQTTINEIVPGTYPVPHDEPTASGNVPCAAMLAAAGVMGALCVAGDLPACAAAGFLIGYAGAAEADGACA